MPQISNQSLAYCLLALVLSSHVQVMLVYAEAVAALEIVPVDSAEVVTVSLGESPPAASAVEDAIVVVPNTAPVAGVGDIVEVNDHTITVPVDGSTLTLTLSEEAGTLTITDNTGTVTVQPAGVVAAAQVTEVCKASLQGEDTIINEAEGQPDSIMVEEQRGCGPAVRRNNTDTAQVLMEFGDQEMFIDCTVFRGDACTALEVVDATGAGGGRKLKFVWFIVPAIVKTVKVVRKVNNVGSRVVNAGYDCGARTTGQKITKFFTGWNVFPENCRRG